LKHRIRASTLNLQSNNGTDFVVAEVITGATSGAQAKVILESGSQPVNGSIYVRNVTGTFVAGETINGSSGHTAVLAASNPVTLGEYDLKYITTPDYVYGVTKVLNIGQASSSKNIFDLQYQLRLNDLYDLTSTSIVYYKTVMSHLSMLDLELNGHPLYRFNRMQNRLYLDVNWETDIIIGDYVLLQGYRAINPADFAKVFGEPWLKHYVTALFKKQWAVNIKKFSGLQLPGGVTLDGDKLYDEAMKEIDALEDELRTKSAPLDFFLG
jgi:hypothetical protein